ncbi:toll/interleukin-1 receptor domain-containing protein [Lysobacter sp. CCNWLW3]|uniref:toll/interleukin-1 receptor domain-containing protein n=1 Tax=unclassified Lysobacter TaxID=2635362 RepID=UPI002FD3549C
MPSVFFSYSHADEALRDQLEKQLAMLKHQGVIETWHDRRIGAGENIDEAIDERINSDEIILLLVSPDFIASHYCYNIEMARAMERHAAGSAIVIPVILRPCDWHPAPFGKLNASPPDGKAVTQWTNIDEAFLHVAKAVRGAAARWTQASAPAVKTPARPAADAAPAYPAPPSAPAARSSNLRLAKTFTQLDKDRFQAETFEFMARYFQNSLSELATRNPGYDVDFRQVDASRFFVSIYKGGEDVARATIYLGGFAGGIAYVHGHDHQSNTMNESLAVQADDQTLFLTSMGMGSFSGRDQKLSQEGAAELLWGMLIQPLQR